MPSSIRIGSAFGANTTNPAAAFNVTSSSISSFAPGRPALVDLTAEQEQPISEFPPFASSSSSGSGTGGSESTDASGTSSENIGSQFNLDDGLVQR